MTKNAWMLPDQISDVLPRQAATLEALRRGLLDVYQQYGYELVVPPLVEFTNALLDEADEDLNLRTVKWADAMTGRTLAVRADITPQVARIDAHLLNRQGVARLCYCGPALHTAPAKPHATRATVAAIGPGVVRGGGVAHQTGVAPATVGETCTSDG